MRIVAALGGNALLKRGEAPTLENQRRNVRTAAEALAPLAMEHELVITHGSGPQVGLLALQSAAGPRGTPDPFDILDAEVQGQIGYLIEQEMRNALGPEVECATLLTQIEVDPADPAFANPSKPIGPFYDRGEADRLAHEYGWQFARANGQYRRVVPSPQPRRVLAMKAIEMLAGQRVVTICAGGGGIPAIVTPAGELCGIEAVIDKDHASALVAKELGAQVFVMLTDIDGVYTGWETADARHIRSASPDALRSHTFAEGSMGPKVEAASDYAEATGGSAGIGTLGDAGAIIAGKAGTLITTAAEGIEYWG